LQDIQFMILCNKMPKQKESTLTLVFRMMFDREKRFNKFV
jgi:hypothetical protein